MIEAFFLEGARTAALLMDVVVVLLLIFGALEALLFLLLRGIGSDPAGDVRRRAWLGFAVWIVLALEFALAADIIRTAIAPSWEAIGQLAAIAAIRTVLNLFLMRDINEQQARRG